MTAVRSFLPHRKLSDIDHVTQAIERTGKGLLGNSEQVVEATHAKFEKFWLKYVVVDLESDVHGERLLECVIDFNSSNA